LFHQQIQINQKKAKCLYLFFVALNADADAQSGGAIGEFTPPEVALLLRPHERGGAADAPLRSPQESRGPVNVNVQNGKE